MHAGHPSLHWTAPLLALTALCGDFEGAPLPSPLPPPPEGSECATPAPSWIWCDDFEVDRLGSYFEAQPEAGSMQRDPTVGVEGSWGLRVRWERGREAAGNLKLAFGVTPDAYMRPVDAGAERYREIYWRFWLRNQEGWTGGGGHKLTRAMSLASPDWAQAMIAHIWSSGPGDLQLAIDPASGTDEAGILRTTRYNDFDRLRWLGIAQSSTAVFAPGATGTWHCIEAHVRLNDAGVANGSFALWIDGEPEAARDGLNWIGTYDGYGINAIFLENYWDDGAPAAQERYLDGFIVSTAPIGCGSS